MLLYSLIHKLLFYFSKILQIIDLYIFNLFVAFLLENSKSPIEMAKHNLLERLNLVKNTHIVIFLFFQLY